MGLKCFYTNARSLRNKRDELIAYIIEGDLDIVCITETWVSELYNGDLIREYELAGYNLHIYQRENKQGGGIFLYVKNNLNSVNINIKNNNKIESIWIEVMIGKLASNKIRIGAFYRPPNQCLELDKEMITEINRGCGRHTLILGDFNLPAIRWDDETSVDRTGSIYLDCFQDNFLKQLVKDVTRGNNILDLVLCNNEKMIKNLTVCETLGDSDHNIIQFDLQMEKQQQSVNREKIPNFAKGEFDKLRSLLRLVNWEKELGNGTVFEMWEKFKEILRKVQAECVPEKIIRTKKGKRPLWWTNDIKLAIQSKKRSFINYKEHGTIGNLEEYRKARDRVNQEVRKNKRKSEIELARTSKKDTKRFFSYFKVNNRKKERVGPIKDNNRLLETDIEIVEALNNHFSSVFTRENELNFLNMEDNKHKLIPDIEVKVDDIKEIVKDMKVDKAAGPDGIHCRIIKEGIDSIGIALKIIFTQSLNTGKIPNDWKIANVVPIFKKGSKELMGNYRPVSLTSLIGKILERIVKKNIEEHIAQENLIGDSQHGFRPRKSCLTNLLEFFEYLTKQMDEGEDVDIIYLDFSKAFDKVPHQRLNYKLREIGIRGSVGNWIEEWLRGRKQRVILNGTKSEWREVISGVPQGSVLGPLLFILYLNDLELGTNCRTFKFADDTKIAGKVGNIEGNRQMQRDLDKLLAWAEKWQMEFNSTKCKVLHIGRRNREFNYEMEGNWLESVNEEKDLGVWTDRGLTFQKQCLEARNRANRVLGFINRNVSYKSKEVVSKLYNGYVRPHLEYCLQSWAPYHRQNIDMLEGVQRRATKLIPGLRNKSYENRLKELGMYSFQRRMVRGDMIEMYKIFLGLDYIDYRKFFEIEKNDRLRGHKYRIKKQSCRLDVRKYNFSLRGVNYWNTLPSNVVNSSSLASFKRNLDKYMDEQELVQEV